MEVQYLLEKKSQKMELNRVHKHCQGIRLPLKIPGTLFVRKDAVGEEKVCLRVVQPLPTQMLSTTTTTKF